MMIKTLQFNINEEDLKDDATDDEKKFLKEDDVKTAYNRYRLAEDLNSFVNCGTSYAA